MSNIGILAYGSLMWEPGPEIAVSLHRLERAETPFKVEFARRSTSSRGGAPTLVPVVKGGAYVKGLVLVLREVVSLGKAKDMLWRRETQKVCSGERYEPPRHCCPNTVCIVELGPLAAIDTVLCAWLAPNIKPLTAPYLAKLAISSVCKTGKGRDGITYLISAKCSGIATPLMNGYEEEIKRQTGAGSLAEALEKVQAIRPTC